MEDKIKETKENIKEFTQKAVYKLYQIDWERRISAERKADDVKDFFESCIENHYTPCFEETYSQWLYDNGYSGELYVCYEEFLEEEFQNKDYIRELVGECGLLMELVEKIWEEEEND